jgi:hypothetical protein
MSAEPMTGQRLARAAVEPLELVEAHDDVAGQARQRAQLGVQQVGHVSGRARAAAHGAAHDLQVEADLALEAPRARARRRAAPRARVLAQARRRRRPRRPGC